MISSLFLVAASLVAPTLAQDPNAPSLSFNWTLRPIDAPLDLTTGWVVDASDPTTAKRTDLNGNGNVFEVDFIGSGITFLGSASNYNATDSNGLAAPPAIANIQGDPTWSDSDAERNVMGPASDTVLWQRSMPRFQEYTAHLQVFNGNWTLKGAEIATGMNSSATDLYNVTTRVEKFIGDDGKINPFYNTTGRWEVTPANGDIPTFAKCYDDAITRVDVPAGTAFLVINGTRSLNSRIMYVKFQDEAGDEETSTVNAVFSYITEAVLYIRPIRTDKKYTLILQCVLQGQGEQGLTSITFYEGE